MAGKIRLIVMALLLVIFCVAGGAIFFTYRTYEEEDRIYEQVAQEYTHRVKEEEGPGAPEEPGTSGNPDRAPLEVDFDRLREINSDVVGWIYCEGTVIDYPVLQGEDDDYYLHRNLNRESHNAGSIFVEAVNQPGFADSNTIIYGHHMKNGSMFASLDNWAEQEYYEEHPIMWLLTPEQDYCILLFAGYVTAAVSDTYTVFSDPCDELEEYLQQCVEKSDFKTDFTLPGVSQGQLSENHKYVLLSTCDYSFQDARYVLHGLLVPVEK